MVEDLKEGCTVAILAAMHEAYYEHHDNALLEKVILRNLEFLVDGVRQQSVPESEGSKDRT